MLHGRAIPWPLKRSKLEHMTNTVVTRFAPSPTGYLHIGGARTALFNWLYARHTGGKILLRIEDTDRERSTEPAIAAILDGLKWLELDWDGEPLSQFARAARHREVAEELLAAGKAYRCYADARGARRRCARRRERPRSAPGSTIGRWRDRDPEARRPPASSPCIRLKAPLEGETVIEDQVQGRVVSQNAELDDMIILRSDGTPIYNLAVVVDDHDMGITHVIRGVDHLTNAARQVQIYQAMGWDVPVFAHVPLIHGPDGAKLSKRHGALGIEAYRAMGYLPAGLRNYLVRLGWSHGDDEIFSTAQAIDWFDIDDINKSPGRLDFAKLDDVNSHYIRQAERRRAAADASRTCCPTCRGRRRDRRPDRDRPAGTGWPPRCPALKERAKTLLELVDGAGYLFAERPLALDDKAAKLLDARGAAPTLGRAAAAARGGDRLEGRRRWRRSFAPIAEADRRRSSARSPSRCAPRSPARTVSPPVFDVMAVLGREEALARIRDQAGNERSRHRRYTASAPCTATFLRPIA